MKRRSARLLKEVPKGRSPSDSLMTRMPLGVSGSGGNQKIKIHTGKMAKRNRLQRDFFTRDVLDVAPDILSKILIVRHKDGNLGRFSVSETEAYRGTEDRACHAFSGRTRRTEIMYHNGGRIYVYLVYGIHWMLNVVTGRENEPQALLIRGLQNCSGPGRVSRTLGIDGSYYGEDLITSERVWFEDSGIVPDIKTTERIGIDYAGEYWRTRPWRFVISG